MAGHKNIENRTWLTHYRATQAIDSTKIPSEPAYWSKARNLCKRLGLAFPESLCEIDGAALGVVDLNYMIGYDSEGDESTDYPNPDRLNLAWWNRGGFGWILENARALAAPIPVSGRLGLYDLPDEVTRKIATELQL